MGGVRRGEKRPRVDGVYKNNNKVVGEEGVIEKNKKEEEDGESFEIFIGPLRYSSFLEIIINALNHLSSFF